MNPPYDWLYSDVMPDGHELFYTADPKKISIGDGSGHKPETTDDGVLWLNFEEPLMLGDDRNIIPLVNEHGQHTRTVTDVATITLLASTYNWIVNVRGILFKIERV